MEFSEGLPYVVDHELLNKMVRGRWVPETLMAVYCSQTIHGEDEE